MRVLAILFLVGCGVEPEVAKEFGRDKPADCCWYWPDTDAIDRCFVPFANPVKCEYLECPLFDYSTPPVCPS